MASNNLRVLYNNLVDNNNVTTTITASSAASASTPASNLTLDPKALVWRSATASNGTSPTLSTASGTSTSQVINPATGTTVASPSVTATTVTTNYITCASTTGFVVGYPVIFGTSLGGLVAGNVYYISAIVSGTQFTVITATKANLILTFSSLQAVRLVALPFTNLSTSSIIRVRGYSGTAPSTQLLTDNPVVTAGTSTIFDTGYVPGVPYSLSGDWSWGATSIGVNTFGFGGGTYARVWNSAANPNCTSLSIEIHDKILTTSSEKYIECSRLVVGDYWTPQYNTEYGLTTTMSDTSTNQRTEAGDLITNRGTKYNKINFNMGYLSYTDRDTLLSIMRGAGVSKPLFISLFPQDTDTGKERAHQVYGKLTGLSSIQHYALGFYSSSLELEEI